MQGQPGTFRDTFKSRRMQDIQMRTMLPARQVQVPPETFINVPQEGPLP